jgi:hypothetical protein
MVERARQVVADGFMRFFGIERKDETGPQEWLQGFVSFISKAKVSIRTILHDDEAYILGRFLSGEEIPDSWDKVHRQMRSEGQQIPSPQSEASGSKISE